MVNDEKCQHLIEYLNYLKFERCEFNDQKMVASFPKGKEVMEECREEEVEGENEKVKQTQTEHEDVNFGDRLR